jgi:transcription elongation factor Elf1
MSNTLLCRLSPLSSISSTHDKRGTLLAPHRRLGPGPRSNFHVSGQDRSAVERTTLCTFKFNLMAVLPISFHFSPQHFTFIFIFSPPSSSSSSSSLSLSLSLSVSFPISICFLSQFSMARKKKAKKPPPKKKIIPIPKTFDCPFCSASSSVRCKLYVFLLSVSPIFFFFIHCIKIPLNFQRRLTGCGACEYH